MQWLRFSPTLVLGFRQFPGECVAEATMIDGAWPDSHETWKFADNIAPGEAFQSYDAWRAAEQAIGGVA